MITVDGKRALTVDLAAAKHGLNHDAMRKALDRAGVEPVKDENGQVVKLWRAPLYLATAVSAALRARPGTGSPGVPRPHRAGMAQRLRAKATS